MTSLDPSDYCIQKKDLYLSLFPVASGILCTPASTAPVECIFSACGGVTKGKRNRLTDNLEQQTATRNKTYLS